jgi:hypothetical protein
MPIGRARMDDIAPLRYSEECWAGLFQKKYSHARCTPHSLPARSIATALSDSNTGAFMGSVVWLGKMSRCGSMRGT